MTRIWVMFNMYPTFDPQNRFETSALFSPYLLGAICRLFALYGVVTIIVSATIRTQPSARQSFSYFSNITWWGITFYHIFASYYALRYAHTGRAALNTWPRVLQLAHSLLFTTVVTFPIMVTVVFWAIQSNSSKFDSVADTWSNISHHALNTAFALFEIIFTRIERPPWIHLPLVLVLLAGYAGIAYITHATQGFYTYGFLDPSKHRSAVLTGILIGMGGIATAVFVGVWLMIWARLWVTEARRGQRELGVVQRGKELQNGSMADWSDMSPRRLELQEPQEASKEKGEHGQGRIESVVVLKR